MVEEKEIRWVGSSYEDLLKFPFDSRREAGFQLGKVQAGLEPDDWKPPLMRSALEHGKFELERPLASIASCI